MPWFPDFAAAAAMVRQETRGAGRADPVGQYLTALTEGDPHALEDAWPGEVVIFDPKAGEVRGHRELRRFVRRSRDLLAGHHARTEKIAVTTAGGRAVVELMAHLAGGVVWPVAVVAESPDPRTAVFRSYFSRRPLDGAHHLRPPILPAAPAGAGGVAGRLVAALAAGDLGPGGRLQEPGGIVRRGAAEIGDYLAGGLGVESCAVTDDGVRCAVEYNVVRWGDHEVPPQAGLAVAERDADGLLAAVRLYDDVTPPA